LAKLLEMAKILRGEIWWADLDPARGYEQKGTRPVLVISHDVFNERSQTVIALAITSQEPSVGFPLVLEITSAKLPKKSWVKMGQVRTLAVERLSKKLARVSPEELTHIVDGLNEIVN
jgi:mRNA interferase MazF